MILGEASRHESSGGRPELSQRGEGEAPVNLAEFLAESGEALLVFDARGQCRYINEPAAGLFHRPAAELLGQHLEGVLPERVYGVLHRNARRSLVEQVALRFETFLALGDTWLEVRCWPDGHGGILVHGRDISERRRLEEALRQGEERWQFALQRGSDGVWEWDLRTRAAFFSERWRALFLTPGERIEPEIEAWNLRIHPDDATRVVEAVMNHLEEETPLFVCEYRLRRGDGYAWVSDRGVALRDEHGEPYRMVGAAADITERKMMEENLRQSRLFAEQSAQLLPDVLYVYDVHDKRLVYSNRKVSAQLGYTPDEWTRLGPEPFSRITHPADLPRTNRTYARVLTLTDGAVADIDFRLRRRDGSWEWYHARESVFARDQDGFPTRIMGVLQCIHARKTAEIELRRSEERLHLALDATQDALWDWDLEGDRVEVNARYLEMLGLLPEEFEGNIGFWEKKCHPDDLARVWQKIHEHMERRAPRFECEYRLRHQEGHYVWVYARGRVVARNERGEPIRMVGTNTDITARRRIEQELNESRDFASRIAQMTPDLLYIYDLREKRNIFVSPSVREILGYEPEEISAMGGSMTETLFHPDDIPSSGRKALLLGDGVSGGVVEHVYRLQHKSGEWRWLHCREMTFTCDEAGKPLQFLGVARDITDYKRLEREREELLAEAIERADQDPLTELLNYRAFHDRLNRMGEQATSEQPLCVAVLDVDNFKFFNDAFGHMEGDHVLENIARALRAALPPGAQLARLGGDEFAALLPNTPRLAAERLFWHHLPHRMGYRPAGAEGDVPLRISCGVALYPDEADTPMAAVMLADTRLMESKRGGQEGLNIVRQQIADAMTGFPLLDALVMAVDVKDRYTRRHSEDVLLYSLMMAQELGWGDLDRTLLQVAALLHDVGKIGVPDRILRLPTRLTEEEYRQIQQHAALGAALATAVLGLETVTAAIRHHHEAWDGTGYPDKLSGEQIPLMARLLAVADAYSALTTDRPYRKGLDRKNALAILQSGAGAQWDPDLVTVLVKIMAPIPSGGRGL